MINNEILQGKWKEIKGEILTQWGKITDDEADQTTGNLVSIVGLIQQKYGEEKEEIQAKLNTIISRFSHKTEVIKEKLKESSN